MGAVSRVIRRVSLALIATAMLITASVYGFFGSTGSTASPDRRLSNVATSGQAQSGNRGKIKICHRTHSWWNPYVKTTVSRKAADAHRRHGDIVPAPGGGCPGPYGHKNRPYRNHS